MPEVRKDALCRTWVHSHEEDTESELLFRPAGYLFPPARGRTSLELRSNGTYVESSPGPVDLPEESTGRWSYEGNRLILGADADRPDRAWEVLSIGADRLIVQRPQ